MADEARTSHEKPGAGASPVPRFGEQPLTQTVAAAAAMRRVCNLLLWLEHHHPAVDDIVDQLAAWERELAAAVPPDPAPRIGDNAHDGQRVYLDHAADIGAYNPCFPEYVFDHADATTARGRVSFPLVYEGPPGLVHGGFLGVFFDCVVQQHCCRTGVAGKTRSMDITYRRPTPILTELDFEITRSVLDRQVQSSARLLVRDEVLCSALVRTVAVPLDQMSTTRYGKRRAHPTTATAGLLSAERGERNR
ncbi:hypothetical protein FEK35_25545 [Nocardia cyriacigeorgica]|uniref:PaaI family thioesterase n=1 Tax=Nocardia cyriacigeorgica TaxID=135487 RepID=A0A5R8P805_9NOCA|nr:hypothetical protein [Nocardia cyriacigeorgica]TLF98264.1 hypothetical protein FEK35_25545 [Nocardia cyriacigeorgica]